ncbi:MAG: T9SS type A sorting domain-containing protein [Bacteroidota bacterium]
MKKILLLFLLNVLLLVSIDAQTIVNLAPKGGGPYQPEPHQCLAEAERSQIQTELQASIARLQAEGLLPNASTEAMVNFDWPLRKVEALQEYNNYFAISNYVDQNFSAGLLDYSCGNRTYDGHRGTDYITWPFPWYLYENNLVEVVAGEAGIIINKSDNNDDDHCDCFGMWNAVYLQHADGSVAWYGHLKRNSLTSKSIGQSVAKGEYLGVVASSGCSTAPHLHLEVYDNQNNLIDPYAGSCNNLNAPSWWTDQENYRNATINAALTHGAPPVHGCPDVEEAPFFKNYFTPGELVYVGAYFRDQMANAPVNYRILRPDGSVWNNWTHSSPQTYSASWWWWSWQIPANESFGTWRFEVLYNGQTLGHAFDYGPFTSTEAISLEQQVDIFPNPTSQTIQLTYRMEEAVEVQLFDRAGKMILPGLMNPQTIDLSHLSDGIYFVQVKTAKSVRTKKVVKISN